MMPIQYSKLEVLLVFLIALVTSLTFQSWFVLYHSLLLEVVPELFGVVILLLQESLGIEIS